MAFPRRILRASRPRCIADGYTTWRAGNSPPASHRVPCAGRARAAPTPAATVLAMLRSSIVVAVLPIVVAAAPALAQVTPPAGTVTDVPAASRLDVDGDGAPDPAALDQTDGFCGFFAKSSVDTSFPLD